MTDNQQHLSLKRSFGMREAITLTVGSVIGVGLFTTGAQIVGILGSVTIVATFIALLVSVYPALLYSEMGAAMPYAGGTYQYASIGLGRPLGMLAGWNYLIALIAVTSGEALAFSFYFKTIFSAFGVTLPIHDSLLAITVIIVFTLTNIKGVELSGRLQNGFMFFFWGVAAIWFVMMIPNINLGNYIVLPDGFSLSTGSFISYVAMIWWCFAGFELCCAMGEEIKYPHINIPRALKLSPFIVFATNALFQWFLLGLAPHSSLNSLAVSGAPYADAMIAAGILGLPLAMLALGIALGGDFSTLNACITATPRYLFTMSRDGATPRFFAKIHPKYNTPYIAITTIGLLSALLVLTNSISYIASVSLFGDLFYYVLGIAAAWRLRKVCPDMKRHYRAPLIQIGAPVSLVIYLVMMSQLGSEAIITGVIWCILGLVIYFICEKRYGRPDVSKLNAGIMIFDEPTTEEQKSMDREYKLWKIIVTLCVLLAIVLFIFPLV